MSEFTSTLYSYDYYLDDGLFKNMVLPNGIDKDVLIDTIMMECGEMQPVWTNPGFMQMMIGQWSVKWYGTFEKWIKGITTEYEPLYNYDRYEDVDEKHDNAIKTHTTSKSKTVGENEKSAYDTNNYTPHDKSTSNGDISDTSDNSDSGTFERKAHMYGNIGVTTSSALLKEFLDISEWNIYNHIKDLFMQDFCIMIY